MVDLRLLSGRLFRSTNGVMFLAAAAFLGTLYLIPLYFQDARHMTALQSGLSTFPEAFGVMIGRRGPRVVHLPPHRTTDHITGGLTGLAVVMLALTQVGLATNLWLIRGLMFVLGLMMAQVMVPNQAASFTMISPESMGRASTFFEHHAPGRDSTESPSSRRCSSGSGRLRARAAPLHRPDRVPPRLSDHGPLRRRRRWVSR